MKTNMIKNFWNILNRNEKNKSYIFIILTLINTAIEFALVIFIVPLTQILLNKNVNIIFFGEISFTKNIQYNFLVLYAAGVLFLIFLIKSLYVTFFSYWQNRFIGSIEARITKYLFDTYLHKNYLYHVKNITGTLSNNVLNEVMHFATCTKNMLMIFTEFLVFISVGSILFIYELKASISIIVFCLFTTIVLNFFQRKYSNMFGYKKYLNMGESSNIVIQSLQGIKDIKLLGREKNFIKNFYNSFKNVIKYKVYYDTLSEVPKPMSELILVSSFIILIFFLSNKNDPSLIIMTTTLFLAVFYRLLPSIIRISKSYQTIQAHKKKILILLNEMYNSDYLEGNLRKNHHHSQSDKINFKEKIVFQNVEFSFPETKTNVINNLNLEINKGQTIGIIGASGAGKSTLIDLMMGLLNPTNGQILIDGKCIKPNNLRSWQDLVGYVPQNPSFLNDTIKNNITFGIEENLIDYGKLSKAIELANLKTFIFKLEKGLDTIIGDRAIKISGGQKQRISIARALYNNPEVIIFDEATSSLDELNENEIINNIKAIQVMKTTIIVAHKMSVLKNCDKIYTLNNGVILD